MKQNNDVPDRVQNNFDEVVAFVVQHHFKMELQK